MTKEQIGNYTRRISQANETQMITILYEMTLDYMQEAKRSYYSSDYESYDKELTRAQNCINELMRSLDTSFEVARIFMQIYIFSKRHLISAAIRKDEKYIEDIIKIFEKLRDCYIELEKKSNAKSLVTGAQYVYAGLTYGPGHLNEMVADPYSNRGFKA